MVDGNLALVDARFAEPGERERLIELMTEFKILPAGRHLWATGVKGSQFLMNCHVAPSFGKDPARHFEFTFSRLMEGGGVGANYTNIDGTDDWEILRALDVHIVCDPDHKDYEALNEAGVLSDEYCSEWGGAFDVEDSREGWAASLVDLVQTFYRPSVKNRARVFDVSRVRPAGSPLKQFGGTASGPLPLARMLIEVAEIMSWRHRFLYLDGISAMEIDHAIAQCVVAGGVRRSARMSIMHWNDPQIEKFIKIKKDGGHWTTNISVEVDEDFWRLAKAGDGDRSVKVTELARHKYAKRVLTALSEGAYHNGEPGIWDSDLSNKGEPNRVTATNPCAEFALEEAECCNLGHVNLAAFMGWDDFGNGFPVLDTDGLYEAHRLMTRFLIRATFSDFTDPEQRKVQDRNRRIGVGHLGVASFLALGGNKFSEAANHLTFQTWLRNWARTVDQAAVEFCHELRIPVPVKRRTIAPTGTVSKMPGVSEGIHPIFSRYFERRIRMSRLDPSQAAMIEDYRAQGFEIEDDVYDASGNTAVVVIPTKDILVEQVASRYGEDLADEIVQSADELTLDELVAFQAMYQEFWADNAVSFTANFDPEAYTAEDIEKVLVKYAGKIKGSTFFPESSMPQSPYTRITKAEYEASVATAVEDGVDEDCASGSCPIR